MHRVIISAAILLILLTIPVSLLAQRAPRNYTDEDLLGIARTYLQKQWLESKGDLSTAEFETLQSLTDALKIQMGSMTATDKEGLKIILETLQPVRHGKQLSI